MVEFKSLKILGKSIWSLDFSSDFIDQIQISTSSFISIITDSIVVIKSVIGSLIFIMVREFFNKSTLDLKKQTLNIFFVKMKN